MSGEARVLYEIDIETEASKTKSSGHVPAGQAANVISSVAARIKEDKSGLVRVTVTIWGDAQ